MDADRMNGPYEQPHNIPRIGARPIVADTDRSKAPAMISNVIAAAPMPNIDASFRTHCRFPELKKLGVSTPRKRMMLPFNLHTPPGGLSDPDFQPSRRPR